MKKSYKKPRLSTFGGFAELTNIASLELLNVLTSTAINVLHCSLEGF